MGVNSCSSQVFGDNTGAVCLSRSLERIRIRARIGSVLGEAIFEIGNHGFETRRWQVEAVDDFCEAGDDAFHLRRRRLVRHARFGDGDEEVGHLDVTAVAFSRRRDDDDAALRIVCDDGTHLLDELCAGERTAAEFGDAETAHGILKLEHVGKVLPVPTAQLLDVVVRRGWVRPAAAQARSKEAGSPTADAIDCRFGEAVGHQVG